MRDALQEFQQVVFVCDLPPTHIAAGDVGTIVLVHQGGAAYEVEVFFVDGDTLDVVTATADQVRPVTERDVLHARPLSPQEART